MKRWARTTLASLFFTSTFSLAMADEDTLTLVLPGRSWALQTNFRGFRIQDQDTLQDLMGLKILAENNTTGLVMSIFLIPAERKLSAESYRDQCWENIKKAPLTYSNIKKHSKNGVAITEYVVKDVDTYKGINQKNTYLYLTKPDTWMDIHFSKVQFDPMDQNVFDEAIASVKLVEPYVPTSMDNLGFGSYFYNSENYVKAAEYLQKALDQEKKKSELSRSTWIFLVNRLGQSYRMNQNIARAQGVFENGVTRFPDCPLFYYNLASLYGERGERDQALNHLKQAFAYKDRILKGEKIPNPTKDRSFEKFKNDPQFRNVLKSNKHLYSD